MMQALPSSRRLPVGQPLPARHDTPNLAPGRSFQETGLEHIQDAAQRGSIIDRAVRLWERFQC